MAKSITVTVNAEKIEKRLVTYLEKEITRVCRDMILIIRDEIPLDGPNPGKSQWRKDVSRAIRLLAVETANGIVTGKIGLPYEKDSREDIIAMIIDQGHAGEIWARPGEDVYDDDMYLHTSTAKSRRRIPQLEQEGVDFKANAMKRIKPQFDQQMAYVVANIPKNLFYGCIKFS